MGRNLDSIMMSLKIVQCLICNRQTPNYDIPFSDFRVLERKEKVLFADANTVKGMKKSKVLGVGVKLDSQFSTANQCIDEAKFAKGVCIECSKYYHIDSNNDIKANKDFAEYVSRCKSSNPDVPVEIENFNRNEIAPFSR